MKNTPLFPTLDGFKSWLHSNEIFFKTLGAVALTVASLVILFSSLSIQKTQKDLQERELLPQFSVSAYFEPTGTTSPDTMVIVARNNGRAANAVVLTTVAVYDVWLSGTNFRNQIYIPVKDYIGMQAFWTPEAGGLVEQGVYTVKSEEGAQKKFETFLHSFIRHSRSQGLDNAGVGLTTFLFVRYQDILGTDHEEIYMVYPGYSYRIIAPDTIKKLSRLHKSWYSQSVSLNDSPDAILERAIAENNKSRLDELLEYLHERAEEQKQRRDFFKTFGCPIENYFQCNPSPPG